MFYTHVAHIGNNILVTGYKDGKRFSSKIHYKPSLYVNSKRDGAEYRTLDNQPVDKIDFESIKDARAFIEKFGDVSNFAVYGLTNWKYKYINDTYTDEIQYQKELISIVNIDIETALPKSGFDSFVETAIEPITAITMRRDDRILVFGYKEKYTPKDKNTHFIHCKDEYDLLSRFLEAWNSEHWSPDVVTGWNIEYFDIPYIINRITRILGEPAAKRLSRWGILFEKKIFTMGREQQTYIPLGLSILDYIQLYKKFTYTQRESYTLNHIAHMELGEKKVDFSEYQNLDDLYENDFEKYIDYNIHDVNLVHRLDEKLKLLDLIFIMAYDAKINYSDTLGSVLPWEIVIHNYLMSFKTVMPLKSKNKKVKAYEGAHVKEPITGLHEWVVSFDLTSLYPHLIIQYNISPETFIGRINGVTVEKLLHGEIRANSIHAMAANGCQYDRVRLGFLPALMQRYFHKRKQFKSKQLKLEKRKQKGENVDNEISKYYNAQMAMKIFLNSAYGAIGNEYFTFYNNDNAEAITLSGQLSIRWVEKHINNFLNEKLGTDERDYIVAMDTDSIYINLGGVVDRYVHNGDDVCSVVDRLDVFSEKIIQPEIDRAFAELSEVMNARENAMVMKREIIASKAIWKAKKMYIMNVWDNEGIRYSEPKLKIMGIEAVRSSVPEVCRDALRKSLQIIMNEDNEKLIEFIKEFRAKFDEMPFADIAFPRGVKGMNKYKNEQHIYSKATPIHTKAALIYNHLLKKHKLDIQPIYDGDKIKYAYLKKENPIHQTVVAAPGYLPKEFGLYEYIDRNLQFEKSFLGPIRAITDLINWKTKDTKLIKDFLKNG